MDCAGIAGVATPDSVFPLGCGNHNGTALATGRHVPAIDGNNAVPTGFSDSDQDGLPISM